MLNLSKAEFKRIYRLARIRGRMVDAGLGMQNHSLISSDDFGNVQDVWCHCVGLAKRTKAPLSIRFYRKTGRMLHA